MKNSKYCCVNCEEDFEEEEAYIAHYRSEHHRYNIKRKLIGLPPLGLANFQLQFQDDKTSRQSSHQEMRCDICCKKFLSTGTYQAHLKSKKHKVNRENIKSPDAVSVGRSESSSDFSIIGAEKVQECLFCHEPSSQQHLKSKHNFPPFEADCCDVKGLIGQLHEEVKEGTCIFCKNSFQTESSVRQHMIDTGHGKLDFDNFSEYEKFYMWKIEEASFENEEDELMESQNMRENDAFQELTKPTLEEIERRRLARIKLLPTGAMINGKEVGYRFFKNYYKQYLGRAIENPRAQYQPAIGCSQDWKNGFAKAVHPVMAPPKITLPVNHR